jgi:uncharacterized protein YbjQ (UPF0145 family)
LQLTTGYAVPIPQPSLALVAGDADRRSISSRAATTQPFDRDERTVYDLTMPGQDIDHAMVTTGIELQNFRVTKNVGVARGIIVRSRSIVGNIGAGIQTLFGGNITLYTQLCEQSREQAFDLMLKHAAEMGANAVIGMRFDATEIAAGVTEVLAYGTAVIVEPT